MGVVYVTDQKFSLRPGADSNFPTDLFSDVKVYAEICRLINLSELKSEGKVLDGQFYAKLERSVNDPGLVCAALYVETAQGLVLRHGVIISDIQMLVVDVYSSEGYASLDIQKFNPDDFPGLFASVGIDTAGNQRFGVRPSDGSDLFLFPLNINSY